MSYFHYTFLQLFQEQICECVDPPFFPGFCKENFDILHPLIINNSKTTAGFTGEQATSYQTERAFGGCVKSTVAVCAPPSSFPGSFPCQRSLPILPFYIRCSPKSDEQGVSSTNGGQHSADLTNRCVIQIRICCNQPQCYKVFE